MLAIKSFLKLILYRPLFNALIFLVWLIPGHNVAWAIIILTIIVRIILLPSSMKAIKQQKKMRDLQPEISALQKQYKDDKQKQSQALMDFYKKNNINPLGSCLPLLIQLPILIILYYVFRDGLNASHFDLLYTFVPRPEALKTVFFGIDLAKNNLYVLPILAGITQFIQAWQVMPPTQSSGEKGAEMQAMISKQMLYLMPIFTIFIAGRLPAALPLYWIVTNLFMIGQQYYVFRKNPKSEARNLAYRQAGSKQIQNSKNQTGPNKTTKRGVEVTVRKKGR